MSDPIIVGLLTVLFAHQLWVDYKIGQLTKQVRNSNGFNYRL